MGSGQMNDQKAILPKKPGDTEFCDFWRINFGVPPAESFL